MILYRITLAIHAGKLVASGNPARWNSKDVMVIYTASSRSLACLENIVHRNSRGLNSDFSTVSINVPTGMKIEKPDIGALRADWREFQNMPYTQAIGDEWITKGKSAILQVPSVIIPEEHNYLLNPAHRDFSKIQYLGSQPFEFDSRLRN